MLCEAKSAADERRVVGVSERVVGRSCRLDAHDLHRRTQRLLRARAVGLGIENQLRVIPFIHPRRIHAVEREVFLQNHNVVEAPGQKGAVFAAPVVKTPALPREKAFPSLRIASLMPVRLATLRFIFYNMPGGSASETRLQPSPSQGIRTAPIWTISPRIGLGRTFFAL